MRQSGDLMPPSPYPRLPSSCGRCGREGAGASVKASIALRKRVFVRLRMSWAMFRSLPFWQRTPSSPLLPVVPASVGPWLPSRGLGGGSKRKAAPDLALRGCATVRVGHDNLDAPPAIQNDGGVLGPKRLVQNASLGFDLPIRRLDPVIEVAINLVA
jgi:hypothetical protein